MAFSVGAITQLHINLTLHQCVRVARNELLFEPHTKSPTQLFLDRSFILNETAGCEGISRVLQIYHTDTAIFSFS